MKIKKSLHSLCLAFLLAAPLAFAESISTGAEAISVAADQRSLSQQMLKNYVLSGLGVRSRKADQALQSAIASFEAQHIELLAYVKDSAIRNQINQLMLSWQQLKPLYEGKPEKARVLELYSANDQLLQQADELVLALRQSTASKVGPLLDMAARQRVYCERLSALYAMMAWGFENQARAEYSEIYSAFTGGLNTLEGGVDNTPLITYSLDDLHRQLKRTQATADANSDTYVPGLVDRSVEKMLRDVDKLQDEYLILARTTDD